MSNQWNFDAFCHISDSRWRQELSNLSYFLIGGQSEMWGKDYAILARYVVVTFERCYEQKKMVSFTSNSHFEKKDIPLCVCHTNLIQFEWQDVYMVFMASASEVAPLWQFYGFHTDTIVRSWGMDEHVSRPHFVKPELLVVAPPVQDIRAQIGNLCAQHPVLLQNTLPGNTKVEISGLMEKALNRTEKLWSTEWRTAVPQIDYFVADDGIKSMRCGYLLPLYLLSTPKADLALLVVNFEGVALVDITTAYTNARIFGRVESEWLKYSMHAQYYMHTKTEPNSVFQEDDRTQVEKETDEDPENDDTGKWQIFNVEDSNVFFLKVWHYNTVYCVDIKYVYQTVGASDLVAALQEMRSGVRTKVTGILCNIYTCTKGRDCDKIHISNRGYVRKWKSN